MKILDKFIIRQYLGTFFFALLLFMAISVVIDITEKINDLLDCTASFSQIIIYYFNWMPYIAGLLAPLFVFIAVIFFTSRLAERTEIIAILSSGTGFYRFIVPYLISALILTILFWFAANYWIPNSNKKKLAFEMEHILNKKTFSNRNYHFKIGNEWYAYVEDYNIESKTGYKFSLERLVDGQLLYKLRADKIIYDSLTRQWTLHRFYSRINTDSVEYIRELARLDTTFVFEPSDIYSAPETKDVMNTTQLRKFVQRERDKGKGGEDVNTYEIEIYDRTNIPLSTLVLTLIGVALSSRKLRGGTGLHLGLGLGIAAAYQLMIRFSQMFAIKGNLEPIIASSITNMVFILIAVYLLYKAPK